MDNLAVEIILVDPKKNSGIKSIDSLAHLICSHDDLKDKKIKGNGLKCIFNDQQVTIDIKQSSNILDTLVFHVIITGNQNSLEPLRGIFLNLVNGHFEKKYIIKDDVSKLLCNEAYPYINNIENLLRQYIMHFMILKVGNEWWEQNVTDNIQTKSSDRNERAAYSKLVNQDIYHIDFKDLLAFIYENFSAIKTKNDILKRLNECKNFEDVVLLKEAASSNFDKFFKGVFDDKFRKSWEELSELRNQVAHNKLFERKNLDRVRTLSNELEKVIKAALSSIVSFVIPDEEVDTYKQKVQEVKSIRIIKILENLDKEYGITYELISEEIRARGGLDFTIIDVIEGITERGYVIGDPLNRLVSFVLSELSEELKIVNSGARVNMIDKKGNPTTVTVWQFIKS